MSPPMKEIYGWGRHPRVNADQREASKIEGASEEVVLTRGLGRSYGDASLPAVAGQPVLGTRRANRILAFDSASGVLRAEAGLSLRDLNDLFPPRGWASPVSPGTQYVTLGGMVASDVHGKNHHVAGCFGEHVRALRMRVGDGRVLEVSEHAEPELFRATLGGMGLTGHVLEVEVALERIPSFWIRRRSERVRDVGELVGKLREASARSPFTMAWIDTSARGAALGRGILSQGRYAEASEAPAGPPRMSERFSVPFDLPSGLIAPWSVRIFNELYFRAHGAAAREGVVHPQGFFYPLDAIRDWNRLYGKRGFVQYQCVLPADAADAALPRLLETLQRRGGASPVSVVKDCGPEGRGLLSFPLHGITLALDLPYRPDQTEALVTELNERVIAVGGRIYLSKDALTRREHFARMEPRLAHWNEVRRKFDPERRISSALSRRLLDETS